MYIGRPKVLSIAGFDPSGGAGILADIKTFEQCEAYGMGVTTAITYQTEDQFLGVRWLSSEEILSQLMPLLTDYTFSAVKIGLVKDQNILQEIIIALRKYSMQVPIVVDPILKATAGYQFHDGVVKDIFKLILPDITLLTPNWDEARAISGNIDGLEGARLLAAETNILLKGGHAREGIGTDYLFFKEGQVILLAPKGSTASPKHGSGCVLSASITAFLSQGFSLQEACRKGKDYTYQYLLSSSSLLGCHS